MGERLTPEQVHGRLRERCGDAAPELSTAGTKDPYCRVKPERLLEVVTALRDDPALRFDFLQCLTAVDWPKQGKLEVVYHFYSYSHHHAFVIKVDLPRDQPLVPSLAHLYRTAEWHEREQFDLLGVGFSGHPDLRRIMLPDDWIGHPLRKDYKETTHYHGMPTSRPSPLELLPIYDQAPAEQKEQIITRLGLPGERR